MKKGIGAREALELLRDGNERYVREGARGDTGPERRLDTARNGQSPFAAVICCSDSRSIPEAVFACGIGDLFVIRVAGNVIDSHQLGSVEYAADHLGVRLVVVLGHTHCGAVEAAIHHDPDGYVKTITDEVLRSIGDETDPFRAACLNAEGSVRRIEESLGIRKHESEDGLAVLPAVLDIETGRVMFLKGL
ncbi:MAG: carbonic anhydrase [Sutterellaceae bacterium]|nr:carbonic anhydrase [Sutterellaceae bacterium]MDD7442239.1 carbonic anhydrase [Sutterellaceae bacterium]MDY2868612.1 carbonic anhydrase [Mesosutterella sp.]